MMDVSLPHTRPTSSPHVAEFISRVLERLKPLMSEAEIHNHVQEENTPESNERTQAVKLLKTGQNAAMACSMWRSEPLKSGVNSSPEITSLSSNVSVDFE